MTTPSRPPISSEDARHAGDLLAELARKLRDEADTVGDYQRAEGLASVAAYLTGTASAFDASKITPEAAIERVAVLAHAQAMHRGRAHEDAIAIALGVLIWLASTSPQPGPTPSQILGLLINSLEIARGKCPPAAPRASA